MLPDEARKAVERMDGGWEKFSHADRQTIKAHLLAREAEVERLNAAWDRSFKQAMQNGESAQQERARAERADALLRECRRFVAWASERLPEAMPTYEQLDAHLSENSNDRA